MFEKIQKGVSKEQQKQAQEKAAQIDSVSLKIITLAAEAGLTINDFEVALQQCLNGIKNVYLSHKVSEFVETPSAPVEQPVEEQAAV